VEFTSISDGGRTYAIAGTAVDTPVRLVTRDSRTEQVAKVGGGAAVGAVLGRVIGGSTRSTVAGAAIGAAAGTAVAIGTADVDAVVDSGSRVTIRLDRSVTIERQES
jgi:outer membrane lipoprotein SlyB